MKTNLENIRQRLLNIAVVVNQDYEFNKQETHYKYGEEVFPKHHEYAEIQRMSGFIMDIYIHSIKVGSYSRLNLKKSGETPVKTFQRLQVEIRYIDENSKFVVKAGRFHEHHLWKQQMTFEEIDRWLGKLEELVKNPCDIEPSHERYLTFYEYQELYKNK